VFDFLLSFSDRWENRFDVNNNPDCPESNESDDGTKQQVDRLDLRDEGVMPPDEEAQANRKGQHEAQRPAKELAPIDVLGDSLMKVALSFWQHLIPPTAVLPHTLSGREVNLAKMNA
jgi:hypothetical protein